MIRLDVVTFMQSTPLMQHLILVYQGNHHNVMQLETDLKKIIILLFFLEMVSVQFVQTLQMIDLEYQDEFLNV